MFTHNSVNTHAYIVDMYVPTAPQKKKQLPPLSSGGILLKAESGFPPVNMEVEGSMMVTVQNHPRYCTERGRSHARKTGTQTKRSFGRDNRPQEAPDLPVLVNSARSPNATFCRAFGSKNLSYTGIAAKRVQPRTIAKATSCSFKTLSGFHSRKEWNTNTDSEENANTLSSSMVLAVNGTRL